MHFVLPESFRPAEFLRSPELCMDDARYFMNLVLLKLAHKQVDSLGFVRLKAEYLRNVMHQKHYAAVIEALVDGGAVRRAPYTVGRRSFGYILAERFVRDKHVRVPVKDIGLIRRLEVFHLRVEGKRRRRMKTVHEELKERQRQLRIHGDRAREIIASLPPRSNPFDVQGILVAAIERGDYHFNVGPYGRVTNAITSMKREVRQTLHVDGEGLTGVDLSCCQPALIARVMSGGDRQEQDIVGHTTPQEAQQEQTIGEPTSIYDATIVPPKRGDFELYRELVQTGKLYDYMLGQINQRGITLSREQLKQRFLANVIAKKKANEYGAEYPSAIEDAFSEMFPTVYRFIRRVNCDGWHHENLIRELQRQESLLVIETVCDDLVRRHPDMFLITLHDSILTIPGDVGRVEQAFHDAFETTGFPMKLKITVPEEVAHV